MSDQIESDQIEIKYLITGQEVELVERVSLGFIVRRLYDADVDGSFDGDPELVAEIFDQPPTEKLHAEVDRLNKEISEKHRDLGALRTKLTEQQAGFKAVESKLSRVKQLHRLMDFIDGKITHYVIIRYQRVDVVEFKDAISSECTGSWDKKLKLLVLSGDSKGDLEWRLNQYRDGSGGYQIVIPATSLEDANKIAREQIILLADEKKEYPNPTLVECAKEFSVGLPVAYLEKLRENERDSLLKQSSELAAALGKVSARLSQL